jgi:RHS repeat-associated protein
MAAIWLGAEKPHQGVSTKNQAWQPAPNVCNSTTALGLRAGWTGNRVRSFCSGEQFDSDLSLYYLRARYYNPNTGRFLSRDPEDGVPTDPKTLHKYLYAGGDPVNAIDPTGRVDVIESIFAESAVISSPLEIAAANVGRAVVIVFCFVAKAIARAQVPIGMLGFGPPGWPGPVAVLCAAFGF